MLCAFDNMHFCFYDLSFDGKDLGSLNGPSRWVFRSPSWFIGHLGWPGDLLFYTLQTQISHLSCWYLLIRPFMLLLPCLVMRLLFKVYCVFSSTISFVTGCQDWFFNGYGLTKPLIVYWVYWSVGLACNLEGKTTLIKETFGNGSNFLFMFVLKSYSI